MEGRFETVPSMTRDRRAPVVPQSLIVEVRRHTLYGKTAFGASAISEKRISCEASSKSVCSRCAKRSNSARLPPKNATCYSSLHSSSTRCSSLHSLYYMFLFTTSLYNMLLYSTSLYYILLYSTSLYYTLLYSTSLYYMLLYPTSLYYMLLYSTSLMLLYSWIWYDKCFEPIVFPLVFL